MTAVLNTVQFGTVEFRRSVTQTPYVVIEIYHNCVFYASTYVWPNPNIKGNISNKIEKRYQDTFLIPFFLLD